MTPSTKAPSHSLILALAGVTLLMLSASSPLHAWDGDTRKIVSRINPTFPELAKRMHVSGIVHLDATVSPDGHVEKVKATSGPPLLCGPAQDAVLHWKFTPAAAESVVSVQINFTDGDR
jgi:outer membrane biosynthesis protein TonB